MATKIQKPTAAQLPPPQGGGQAPLPANIAKGAKAPAMPAAPKAAPAAKLAPAPQAQKPAAPKTAPTAKSAKVTTQTIGPKTTAKVPPGTKVTTKTVTTIGTKASTKKVVPATLPITPAPTAAPAAPTTGTPAATPATPNRTPLPPTRSQRIMRRFDWKSALVLLILALLLLLLARNGKPLYQKVSNWFRSGWNTPTMSAGDDTGNNNAGFIPLPAPTTKVEVVVQDLSTARRIDIRSAGTIPSGSYHVEAPTINFCNSNSIIGTNIHIEFNYRSGDGNVKGNGNVIGNDCGNSSQQQSHYVPVPVSAPVAPAPVTNPGSTHDWQGSAPPQYAPAPDYPPQSYVAPIAPPVVYAAPVAYTPYNYNISYSHPQVSVGLGFGCGGGYRGGPSYRSYGGCYRPYQYNISYSGGNPGFNNYGGGCGNGGGRVGGGHRR